MPPGYEVGIVPASDTGAVEMVMWSMLGPRPVDVCHWETFGSEWYTDAVQQLKLKDVRNFGVDAYGKFPDLSGTDPAHDIIFTMNGTTSGGVRGSDEGEGTFRGGGAQKGGERREKGTSEGIR